MMARACFAALVLLALAPALAQEAPSPACADADKACHLRAQHRHAARRIDTWKADLARPLDARIGTAPPALVEYLTLDNLANGYPQRPRAALLEPAFLQDVQAAVAGLPPRIWRLFSERLVGVYFVDDLGGTGFTDLVRDGRGRTMGAYIVLDAAVLRPLKANAWAMWKEGTPFKPRAGWSLEARIEDAAGDNRSHAIQYVLLHELGHVFAAGAQIHPPWDMAPKDVPASAAFPFYDLSWRLDRAANRHAALADAEFPQRRGVAYYFGAKLDAQDMVDVYGALAKTNFPTLYAATQPGDDFAESFASYVHVVLMRRPWRVTISKDGRVVQTFDACWEEPRCASKRRLLEQLLGL